MSKYGFKKSSQDDDDEKYFWIKLKDHRYDNEYAGSLMNIKGRDLSQRLLKDETFPLRLIDPSEEVCRFLVKNNPKSIMYLNPQTESLCWYALGINPKSISGIKNPTKDMVVFCLIEDPRLMFYIRNKNIAIDEDVQERYIQSLFNSYTTFVTTGKVKNNIHTSLFSLSERLQILVLKYYWHRYLYDYFLRFGKYSGVHGTNDEKSEWFHKEINRLKLCYGPLKERDPIKVNYNHETTN